MDVDAVNISADRTDGGFTAMTEIVSGDIQAADESATEHSFGEIVDSREKVTCK